MKILKRRDKLDRTITVRVPEAIKSELGQLRQRADAVGFDVGVTLRESLVFTIQQIASELEAIERKQAIQASDALSNDVDHNVTTSRKVKAA